MANIKLKSIQKLETWNAKELRKLKITLQNRMESLKNSDKPKPLPKNNPLHDLEFDGCNDLLEKVKKAEKNLTQND